MKMAWRLRVLTALQRSQIQFLARTWWLTTIYDPSSNRSDATICLWHAYMHAQICKKKIIHTYKIKYVFLK